MRRRAKAKGAEDVRGGGCGRGRLRRRRGNDGAEGELEFSLLIIFLFPFPPCPANLSPSSSNFMHASQMLTETTTPCEAVRAMCTLKRLLSPVYPFMTFQGVLKFEQFSTVLAFISALCMVIVLVGCPGRTVVDQQGRYDKDSSSFFF